MARVDEVMLDKMNAAAERGGLGDRLAATPVVIKKVVDANATSGLTVEIPYDVIIVDVVVQCTATNSSGTLQLRSGTTAITDAIDCDTNHAIDRAATIDDAETEIKTSDSINVISNGANDRGIMYIIGMRY